MTWWVVASQLIAHFSAGFPSDRCKAFQTQLQAEAVQIALCAQVKAFACQTVLGCCAGSDAVVGEWLTEWVRDRVYGANAPVPSLPIAACQAEVGDKKSEQAFCDQCVDGCSVFCAFMLVLKTSQWTTCFLIVELDDFGFRETGVKIQLSLSSKLWTVVGASQPRFGPQLTLTKMLLHATTRWIRSLRLGSIVRV